ncbi:NnrU family protein [Alsobacter ponti]
MLTLIAGLILLLGVHVLTTLRPLRAQLVGRLGEGLYKGLYSLASLLGLLLIVFGYKAYRASGYIDVWSPPLGMRHLVILLMWFAMVALVAAYAPPSRIKRALKHPMLVGVKIWALAHLLANGDLGSIVLFGSVLAWAVYDRISLKRREPTEGAPALAQGSAKNDVIVVAVGTVVWVAVIWLHPYLIGVPVIG